MMQHSIIFTGNTSISNHHFRAVGLLNIEEAETSPIDWILTLLRHFMIFLVNTWLLWLWYEEVWKIFVQRFFHSCHSSTISQITFQGVLIYNCFFFFYLSWIMMLQLIQFSGALYLYMVSSSQTDYSQKHPLDFTTIKYFKWFWKKQNYRMYPQHPVNV